MAEFKMENGELVPLTPAEIEARAAAADAVRSFELATGSKTLAQAALDRSDLTVLRCVSAGIAVPGEWQAYRAALRVIVTSGDGPLPERPEYPVGS